MSLTYQPFKLHACCNKKKETPRRIMSDKIICINVVFCHINLSSNLGTTYKIHIHTDVSLTYLYRLTNVT